MLIEELLGKQIIFESNNSSSEEELKDIINDIILRLRQSDIEELDLNLLAVELGRELDGIYINIDDAETKNLIINLVKQNDWVKGITPNGVIQIKKTGEVDIDDDQLGDELKKAKEKEQSKIQKIASKNVKAKSKGKNE